MKDLCLQFAVLAGLYSLQFLLRHQADLDGCQHSLSVKELDKKVHRQLATSGGSAIEAMVPSLNVVGGANGMFEYCPVCWAPSGSMNPSACVQWKTHPCSFTFGYTSLRAAQVAFSKSNVICFTAGAEGRISRSFFSTLR